MSISYAAIDARANVFIHFETGSAFEPSSNAFRCFRSKGSMILLCYLVPHSRLDLYTGRSDYRTLPARRFERYGLQTYLTT